MVFLSLPENHPTLNGLVHRGPITTNGIITTIAGNGTAAFSGDGGFATNAALNQPTGIAIDASGNLYLSVEPDKRVRKVATNGIITTVAGNGGSGSTGDGGVATNATFRHPRGIAIDVSGNLFIGDFESQNIRKVATNGVITTIAGNGTQSFQGDGGIATSAAFSNPELITVDRWGNIYIADGENFRVRKVSTNNIVTTVAGNGGYGGFSGDGGAATNAALNLPFDVAVDANSNLFIADLQNNRIRKVTANGMITTVAGNGGASFSGDNGFATEASLNNPGGVAIDADGNLFIADFLNSRIRKVDYLGAQPTLKLNAVSTNNAGNYAVIVTDGVGNSVTSSVVRLTIVPPGYRQIVPQSLSGSQLRFAFTGLPGTNYVLERTLTLAPAYWQPQFTNPADGTGAVLFTNFPVATTNNFWRIRSLP